MPDPTQQARLRHLLREAGVPALMVVAIGFYTADSTGLSNEALILPGVLIATLLVSLAVAMFDAMRSVPPLPVSTADDFDDETAGPILAWKPWLLVALPLVLTAALRDLGGLATLVALTFLAQFVFSRDKPVVGFALAAGVAIPTYALFKYFLYVRFPDGALGLG